MKTLNFVPLAGYFVLFTFACFAFYRTGHWPYYAHPDPSELQAGVIGRYVSWSAIVGFTALLLLPLGYGFHRVIAAWKHWPIARSSTAWVYVLGAAVWILDLAPEFINLPWSSLSSWILD